jgi:hypothetical protein
VNRLLQQPGHLNLVDFRFLVLLSLFHSNSLFNVSYFKIPRILTQLLYGCLHVLHCKVRRLDVLPGHGIWKCFESIKHLLDLLDLLRVQIVRARLP